MKKSKDKKLHLEIMPKNERRIKEFIEEYNNNPGRITPCIKVPHVLNMAIFDFLEKRQVPGSKEGKR